MTFLRTGPLVHCRIALAAAASLTVLAAPAGAAVVETPNACKFGYDGEYRTQGIEVTASAPATATAGQPVTLTGEELEVKLREQLASDAAQVGLLPSSAGGTPSTVVTKTWFAIKGTNTREGTQVIGPVSVTATTTAYFDEAGQSITATPFVYTPPKLPDTTWTATGGEIAFSQAGPGAITAALGQLPVGGGGSNVTVAGSAVVQANLPAGANFFMDCQPGETVVTRPQAGAGTSLHPLTAGPFATVAVAGPATNPGGAPPPGSGGAGAGGAGGGAGGGGGGGGVTTLAAGRVLATALAAKRGKVKVRISCPAGGAGCAGKLTLRTRAKVKLGSRKAKLVTLARTVKYSIAKGKAKTLTLSLGLNGKNLVKRKRTQAVTLVLKPAKGKSATKNLRLRRG